MKEQPQRVSRRTKYHRVTDKEFDYLKYHRVVMAWARRNYEISTAHLDMLFFLYSEGPFNRTKLKQYALTLPFDRKKLERMISEGWIKTWRSEVDHRYAMYDLTHKSKILVSTIYKKLNGEQDISEDPKRNVLMKPQFKKTYSIVVKKINKAKKLEIEKKRRSLQEDE